MSQLARDSRSHREMELGWAQDFCLCLNLEGNTDYFALSSTAQNDSVDAMLRSKNGSHAEIKIQISRAGTEEYLRARSVKERLEREIPQELALKGIYGITIWVHLKGPMDEKPPDDERNLEGERARRLKKDVLSVVEAQAHGITDKETKFSVSDWLSPVFEVVTYRSGGNGKCDVDIMADLEVPLIGIPGAVDLKIKMKYSDAGRLWLLVVATSAVLSVDEVEKYLDRWKIDDGFSQVWYLYPYPSDGKRILQLR